MYTFSFVQVCGKRKTFTLGACDILRRNSYFWLVTYGDADSGEVEVNLSTTINCSIDTAKCNSDSSEVTLPENTYCATPLQK